MSTTVIIAAIRRVMHGAVIAGCIAIATRAAQAQVVDPVTAQQEPIPGAGHSYIGSGTESVNPADGSLTFTLPIQTAPGRQLNLPFSIRYNTAEPFYIFSPNTSGMGWTTPIQNKTASPFDINGWSYGLPNYQAQAYVASATPVSSGCGNPDGNPCPGNNTNYCWSANRYTFQGFEGTLLPLSIVNSWPDPNNPTPNVCTQTTYPNYGNADNDVIGVMTAPPQGTVGVQPPLTVTDKGGTVYQFPSITVAANPSIVPAAPFAALAQSVTDRNGNQITLSGTITANTNGSLPSGYYLDTAGRHVVAWSGFGNPSGDQITFSGLPHALSIIWTTATVTPPGAIEQTLGDPCSFGSSPISMQVVSEIVLPNQAVYKFDYQDPSTGMLSKITFPDGGYVRYVWGVNPGGTTYLNSWYPGHYCAVTVDVPAITDRYVSLDGSTEILHQHFDFASNPTQWSSNSISPGWYWTAKNTTVTTSELTSAGWATTAVTRYAYTNDAAPDQGNDVALEKTIVYQDGSGHTLQMVNKSWLNAYTPIGTQTILDNGQGITTLHCVDVSGNVSDIYEYNFQSQGSKPADPRCNGISPSTLSAGMNAAAIGPLMRHTNIVYHSFANGTHITNEPDTVTVFDGSGNRINQTSYLYDGSGVLPSGAKTGLVSPPGARGNVTSVSQWLNTNNSFLTTTYAYFDTGQVRSIKDACGNGTCSDVAAGSPTTFSYSDVFYPGTGSPTGQTFAYLTQVTDPLGHNESYSWGFADGLLRSHQDQNSKATTYQYNDPLLRLKQVQGPADPNNGNQSSTITYSYTDWTPASPEQSTISKSILENTSGTTINSTTTLDGMGHVVHSVATSDPSGPDTVDTSYSGLGRVNGVSNPYRSMSETTYGLTANGYDALGRKTSQTDSDGVSTQTWQYYGTTVTYTDENHNQWQRTSDALGNLVDVVEPNGAETRYGYDLQGDLISVNQCGGSCPSSNAITRQFTYDNLRRLIQSYNPETGWTCYGTTGGAIPNGSNCQSGYDANGNVAVKTDARSIVTTYLYDALNRIVSKSYHNDPGGTPSSCFQYDASSVSNSIGRLTNEWTQSASRGSCAATPPSSGVWSRRTILAYDPMGHILNEQQCTPSNCTSGTPYAKTYTYDLAGNLISSTNGITSTPTVNTLTFTSSFDSAGRLQSVTSNWSDATHPAALFSAQAGPTLPCSGNVSAPYAAFGGLMNATFGTGLSLNRSFDNRLRTTCEVDTGGTVVNATAGSASVSITGAEQSK